MRVKEFEIWLLNNFPEQWAFRFQHHLTQVFSAHQVMDRSTAKKVTENELQALAISPFFKISIYPQETSGLHRSQTSKCTQSFDSFDIEEAKFISIKPTTRKLVKYNTVINRLVRRREILLTGRTCRSSSSLQMIYGKNGNFHEKDRSRESMLAKGTAVDLTKSKCGSRLARIFSGKIYV